MEFCPYGLLEGKRAEVWVEEQGLERYFGSSVKGETDDDWDDEEARQAFLQAIVPDADRVLELARQAQRQLPEGDRKRRGIVKAAELLGQLLLQDVEHKDNGADLKEGVSHDHIPSVHDPEIRHGRKSSSVRFNGYKAAVAVDIESQLITTVEVLPGNAPDNTGALELVKQSEKNTVCQVEETIGDCVYEDGAYPPGLR